MPSVIHEHAYADPGGRRLSQAPSLMICRPIGDAIVHKFPAPFLKSATLYEVA